MNQSKVIFLDVDGVLNDAATSDRAPGGFIGLSPGMIGNLKKIVDATSARIVLVSTWKSEWSADPAERTKDGEYLHHSLESVGLHIEDKTEDKIVDRGTGIVNWLSAHPEVKHWIVLDDDVFGDYLECGVMKHLVHTRYMYGGLTADMANIAIRLLNDH